MGTRIDSVATSHPRRWRFGRGALHLSDTAARRCLERAHLRASELDLIVNVGLYKDGGLAEPALAAIIQDDIGANPGHPPRDGFRGTFSFDLLAGGCGVVTAAYVLHGFVGPGAARRAMVVAGDSDPEPRTSRQFPFAPAGAAMILTHDAAELGFERFAFATFPEHAPLFEAALRWEPRRPAGRHVLEVYEAPSFGGACVDHGVDVARRLIGDAGLRPSDIDLVIASQYPRSFALGVTRGLGIDAARVPAVELAFARAHTAGPIAALDAATRSGAFASARRVLFVTAGAGVTIAAALYRRAASA
jgi:3-oxoacyl-[acyl-carrier-protein] synthase-3